MKLIFRIAKNELRNLFYTPVAWFLLVIFWLLCAFYYVGRVYQMGPRMYNIFQEKPWLVHLRNVSLTEGFITHPTSGMIADVLKYLYLFIPLLTMSVISREFNNGTFKLLYSSPLRMRQLVLGKYLGICLFNLLFLLILSVFLITAAFDIKSVDYGLMLSAALGVWLLLSTYAAIGFFTSSLTRYPIVSAIISFVILTILANVHELWQEHAFVRDLTYFLSLKNRSGRLLKGLITTKDIIYYLSIIMMFMSFTLLILKGKMQSGAWYQKAGKYLAVITLTLTVGYLSSRQSAVVYLDASARDINTLHPITQQQLKAFGDGPLEVTLYTNLFHSSEEYYNIGYPQNINRYMDLWEPYRRFKPDIRFKYVYYYAVRPGDSTLFYTFPGKTLKQIAGLVARTQYVDSALFMGPEEVKKIVDLDSLNYRLGTKLSWKGRSVFINYFPYQTGPPLFANTQSASEPAFNAAFNRLTGNKMPRLGFITGQLERSILKFGEREYAWMNSLYPLGFDMDTLNLSTQGIPEDMTTLVLADPKVDLQPVVMEKLNHYIRKGGNLFILGEPGKQQVLNPLLQQLGVQLMPGQLVQPSFHETPDKIKYYKAPEAYKLGPEGLNQLYTNFLAINNNQLPEGDTIFDMTEKVSRITYHSDSGFSIFPLLMTQPEKVWQKMGKLVTDSTAPLFNPEEGDLKESSYPLGIRLSRLVNGKEQRIVVMGDADLAGKLRANTGRGFTMIRSVFYWLSDNRYPVYLTFPVAQDNWLTMTPGWTRLEKLLYIFVIPSLILLLGIILLIRRKRK
ncbi:Gldg family protein [Pseudobacter ginsenosidimutans]|uniref:ABC-2 type transport system permease protein n=1 Tax=Pseudobacter ginsenosidimutans TaxID=661488 RepID=A0A4Q7MVV5_9BACT|nr:Gldg family protein [Pseudobacter ginsenosidimutans]QEC40539.1 ABC transporter permease subunit [Pseudobacter ginsenosidimutans]RZS72748.1 ABC-2 type transport system permease protein [Pseudobacter ginsenosidimutans]